MSDIRANGSSLTTVESLVHVTRPANRRVPEHQPRLLGSTVGDHYILKCYPPDDHDTDPRTVVVPRHGELDTGTLKSIGEQAGMKDFTRFKAWIARNR
ncbi:type II toxin-antitoxin system HicA family toxin [Haloferax namakaokahaiae]|uniref:Type II toxin-antitoxin system HicA family toxin n=1 Tax=Haloferax namakaokahaiae TaxID=1748331 RepID=A0ABD5ZCC6_9EURY